MPAPNVYTSCFPIDAAWAPINCTLHTQSNIGLSSTFSGTCYSRMFSSSKCDSKFSSSILSTAFSKPRSCALCGPDVT